MEFQKYSKELLILDNGSLISFDDKSDISIKLIFSSDFGFCVSFVFDKDGSNEPKYDMKFDEEKKTFTIKCINCDNPLGNRTTNPIQLATFQGKKVFLNAWIYSIGKDNICYKIDYCIYKEA